MANLEHLAWLEEGPNRWNARRESRPFRPDLESGNISKVFGAEDRDYIHSTQRAQVRGINFSFANLKDATLNNVDFTGANFVEADLNGARLINSLFTKALFAKARLRHAKPHSANFSEAKFLWSELDEAQFVAADLRRAQLWRCSLKGAHLYNADLTGTDFLQSRPVDGTAILADGAKRGRPHILQ